MENRSFRFPIFATLLKPNRKSLATPAVGASVILLPEPGEMVPSGRYTVSKVNSDGSFHVGGNTAIWPRRVAHG